MKWKMPIESAECLECVPYFHIPPSACLITWKHIKRNFCHHGSLQSLSRAVVEFWKAENVSSREIYRGMQNVCSTQCVSPHLRFTRESLNRQEFAIQFSTAVWTSLLASILPHWLIPRQIVGPSLRRFLEWIEDDLHTIRAQ